MNQIASSYLSRAELWLLISVLAYYLLNGAGIYETAVLIPKWSANPPESLSILQGRYAPDLKRFWIAAHVIHEITFIIAIWLCWKLAPIRNELLVLFGIHFLIRVWTIGYFAPRIIAFQQMDLQHPIQGVIDQVNQWQL